jgi:translocation and assembly module TamB
LGITFLTLYSGWRFIHSEKFSRVASLKVSKILTEKAGAKLSFSGVDFSLVPLSTTFKNVKITKNDPALIDVDVEAGELQVVFTYSSFIASEPEIDEVNIRDGLVSLKIHKKSEEDINLRKLKTREVFSKYTEILNQIPVRLDLITLEKIQMTIDDTSLLVNKASFSPQKLRARFKADVSNLKIDHDNKDLGSLEISNIQLLFSANKDEWRVDNLKVTKDKNIVSVRAVAFNEGNLLYLNTNGSMNVNAEELLTTFKALPKDIASIKGNIEGKFTTSGVIDNPDGTTTFIGRKVDTEWIKLDVVMATVSKKKNFIIAQKLSAAKDSESYELKKPQTFFDLRLGKFTNFNFSLRLKDAFTNTFLQTAKSSLGTLKGYLTGDVEASLFDDRAVFTIRDNVQVKNFKLTTTNGKTNILSNPGFTLDNTSVVINQDFSVNIDLKANMPNTRIQAKGKITDKRIDIVTTDSKIDMQSFGPISGIKISGSGPAELKVSGPTDDVVFNFNVDWNNFSLLELNFGRVKADFSLALKNLLLNINSLDGTYNKSNYTVSGLLGFEGPNEGMDLKLNFKNTNFSDARKMLPLVFKNIKLPVDPQFNFEANYIVKGGYDLPKLRVEGLIKGTELKVANEEAEKISLNFTLLNNLLNFKQIKINKSRGELNAAVSINLANNYIELNGATQGFRLRDFNFYRNLSLEYDGDLFLDFDGNGTTQDFSSRFKARVANAFIGNMPASSSNAIFYVNSNDVVTNASLLGSKIKVDSLMSLKTGIAAIKASIDTNDMKEFLGILSSHNISDKGISGRIKAQFSTQISMGSLGVRKFFMNIDQLNLKRGDINLEVDPRFNSIEVDDGVVKKWDLRLRDGKEFISSRGRNISNGVIGLEHRFALKASLLEIAAGQIERATGIIKGNNSLVLDKKITVKDFSLYGDDHSLKIKGVPGYVTNLDYSIVKKGEIFEVSRMTGEYGEGDFKVNGKVVFDDRYPDVSLTYQVDRATIPLFKRSNVMVSSNGTLIGTTVPYKLTGKLSIMHAEILDDPADLMKENKVSIDEYKKYLPEKDFLGNKGIIDLNISFDTPNPVIVKNNMAEVYIKGSGQLSGDIQSPEISTRLEIVPNVSKFKFKGHDFALNQGYVEIRDRGKNRMSDLKFSGVAKINDYDMKLDLSGSISKVNVDLSSEPALSKEDLLSLLTLGVTSDMSKNLEAGERKFVTTVGIGTLLVDQLKINEDLNATLGVKLSVQPEFKEDETTLIQGKSAVTEGSTSRLKSATKIKINKQINKRVDVSLSSTIGGSLEQKQEMNINLNINKNFSLEGVYEVKPTEDENTTTPNSLGADLKWRKSF